VVSGAAGGGLVYVSRPPGRNAWATSRTNDSPFGGRETASHGARKQISNIEQGISNREVSGTSKFDIPCSIFDISSGSQKNDRQASLAAKSFVQILSSSPKETEHFNYPAE
jgi:hypothetical protein